MCIFLEWLPQSNYGTISPHRALVLFFYSCSQLLFKSMEFTSLCSMCNFVIAQSYVISAFEVATLMQYLQIPTSGYVVHSPLLRSRSLLILLNSLLALIICMQWAARVCSYKGFSGLGFKCANTLRRQQTEACVCSLLGRMMACVLEHCPSHMEMVLE